MSTVYLIAKQFCKNGKIWTLYFDDESLWGVCYEAVWSWSHSPSCIGRNTVTWSLVYSNKILRNGEFERSASEIEFHFSILYKRI